MFKFYINDCIHPLEYTHTTPLLNPTLEQNVPMLWEPKLLRLYVIRSLLYNVSDSTEERWLFRQAETLTRAIGLRSPWITHQRTTVTLVSIFSSDYFGITIVLKIVFPCCLSFVCNFCSWFSILKACTCDLNL